jgi:hypothetical protein
VHPEHTPTQLPTRKSATNSIRTFHVLGRIYKGVFEKYLGWSWNLFDFTL